jgi:PhnB protein
MSTQIKRPEGFHSITPSLTIKGCAAGIEFYTKAFNAVERYRLDTPDGTVMHAEIAIGDSIIMMSDELPDWGCLSPLTTGGNGATYMIYTSDADALFAQAVAAGATVIRPLENQFWGDRSGQVADPFGYKWSVATHIEEVSPEEIGRRAAAMFA